MGKLLYTEFTKTNIMCEFIIDGDDFDPEIISKSLEIKPSRVKTKGDESPINNFSAWELSTGYKETLDSNEQINKLLNVLKPKKNELLQLKKMLSLDYRMEIVINIESQQTPAIYLCMDVLQFCNDLEIEVDFDLYIMS